MLSGIAQVKGNFGYESPNAFIVIDDKYAYFTHRVSISLTTIRESGLLFVNDTLKDII